MGTITYVADLFVFMKNLKSVYEEFICKNWQKASQNWAFYATLQLMWPSF